MPDNIFDSSINRIAAPAIIAGILAFINDIRTEEEIISDSPSVNIILLISNIDIKTKTVRNVPIMLPMAEIE